MNLTGGKFGPLYPCMRQASLMEWGFIFKNTTYMEWVWKQENEK